jgi:membrane-bound metal-dependent hydrolase YbcI (DUF457 family)
MPFTPLHLGPSLVFGLPLRKKLHLPTLLVASVAIDVEPFLVLVLGLNYPLHGYLHTFLLALPFGVMIGYTMFLLEKYFCWLWRALHLEECILARGSFIGGGVLGTFSHVLLDSPLYSDIKPFFPLEANPLYAPWLNEPLYELCLASFIFGVVLYLGVALRSKLYSVSRGDSL